MTEHSIYKDIAERTGGDIYVGVVGPVRSGKSTFIKRFMESVVLPNIGEGYSRDRARDELPQSAAGKTVMTTEPKFIPEEAVPILFAWRVDVVHQISYTVNYHKTDTLNSSECFTDNLPASFGCMFTQDDEEKIFAVLLDVAPCQPHNAFEYLIAMVETLLGINIENLAFLLWQICRVLQHLTIS